MGRVEVAMGWWGWWGSLWGDGGGHGVMVGMEVVMGKWRKL